VYVKSSYDKTELTFIVTLQTILVTVYAQDGGLHSSVQLGDKSPQPSVAAQSSAAQAVLKEQTEDTEEPHDGMG
jgi:hypothetical protein